MKQQNTSLIKKFGLHYAVIWAAALPVALFCRKDVGYRMLHRGLIAGISAVMFITAMFLTPAQGHGSVGNYAVTVLIGGFITFFIQRRAFNRLTQQDPYCIGTSRTEAGKSPQFLIRNRRLERFVEPSTAFAVGVLLFFLVATGLGVWVMVSSCALLIVEAMTYAKTQENNLGSDLEEKIRLRQANANSLRN